MPLLTTIAANLADQVLVDHDLEKFPKRDIIEIPDAPFPWWLVIVAVIVLVLLAVAAGVTYYCIRCRGKGGRAAAAAADPAVAPAVTELRPMLSNADRLSQ
ncbi:hypothetical protein PRIPAC_88495 [Pristionchus pacificus]|uniref:Uncharacterized protein n=1 Tax=Pristionchus pacificus TaxID=54126 RepID=A0A2A6CWP0_PRIPA|nr:hypothetical protein PRIPAC_88495 [Pristionchus pacificus]|eukprot:PDM82579.1 hypothetical protein PRIPAC_36972 [Pristionchus pacificus]